MHKVKHYVYVTGTLGTISFWFHSCTCPDGGGGWWGGGGGGGCPLTYTIISYLILGLQMSCHKTYNSCTIVLHTYMSVTLRALLSLRNHSLESLYTVIKYQPTSNICCTTSKY
jgi:hypothetical protein